MLIPMADVPRWYAERRPKDTIAISHGKDTLTWEELERGARARAFTEISSRSVCPIANAFFETTFAVWKCGATPTSLSWRLPRGEAAAVLKILKPALVVGGEADWNAPNSLPADFVPEGLSDEPLASPVARHWKGYLYLGDRLADMILRGGANIYPAEVEAAVTAHPSVRSCVVVGLPDPEFGQRVHAILELDRTADVQSVADDMCDFLKERLSRYKQPGSFEVVSVALRDDSGKVRRTSLRDERAAWLRESRSFRIMPQRVSA